MQLELYIRKVIVGLFKMYLSIVKIYFVSCQSLYSHLYSFVCSCIIYGLASGNCSKQYNLT